MSVIVVRVLGIECTFNNCCVAILDGDHVVHSRGSVFVSNHSQDTSVWREALTAFHREQLGAFLDDLAPLQVARIYLSVVAAKANPNVAAVEQFLIERKLVWTPVDHESGHLYGTLLEHRVEAPFIALTIAGGHSHLYLVRQIGQHELLGSHEFAPRNQSGIGRAVGAQLDACAILLGLAPEGQPDGAIAIDRLGDLEWEHDEPIPMTIAQNAENGFHIDLSLLLDEVATRARSGDKKANERLAVAVQRSVMRLLLDKCFRAARMYGVPQVLFGGGVAANTCLRRLAAERSITEGCRVYFPSRSLCTDNAIMIAFTGCLLDGVV
jgi:N6-L-threonylcarbamoyladenine synthase